MARRDAFEMPWHLLVPQVPCPEVVGRIYVIHYLWGPAGDPQSFREVEVEMKDKGSGPEVVGAALFRSVSAVRRADETWFGGGCLVWGSRQTTEKERDNAARSLREQLRTELVEEFRLARRRVEQSVGRTLRLRKG